MIRKRGYGRREGAGSVKTSMTRTVILLVLVVALAFWLIGTDSIETLFKGWLAK